MLKNRRLRKLGDQPVVFSIYPSLAKYYFMVKYGVLMLAVVFLILGLVNPQSGKQSITSRSVGFEVNFVVDVSNSMLAQDIKPSRLEATKKVLYNLSKELRDHKIGITVFAGEAFNQIPPTADPNIVDAVITALSPESVPTQGSNIGKAIELAIQNFDREDKQRKFLVLITDGENHEGEFLNYVKDAGNQGISISVIGVGGNKGANIPVVLPNGKKGLLKDEQGKTVITALNEENLQQIASDGQGLYAQIDNDAALTAIVSSINNLPRKVYSENVYSSFSDYFAYFIICCPGTYSY